MTEKRHLSSFKVKALPLNKCFQCLEWLRKHSQANIEHQIKQNDNIQQCHWHKETVLSKHFVEELERWQS